MFLILITPQIVNLKMIRDVLKLRKCYQCGGETLVPVVKHSVSNSMPPENTHASWAQSPASAMGERGKIYDTTIIMMLDI
jgi:hypothetical protein